MPSFLIFTNIHLGLELFGAIVFFIVSWLFLEAYWIKRDLFSLGRTVGFALLTAWQIIHALSIENGAFMVFAFVIYLAGLVVIFLTYWFEKLPPKPAGEALALSAISFNLVNNFYVIPSVLLALISFALVCRYFKDIDRLLKWMAIAFVILAISSVISSFNGNEIANPLWIIEHILRLAALIIMVFWIWLFLSLRLKEETLIVFISISLFISLLVTTTFSTFLMQRTQQESEKTLTANAKIMNFYVDNLKSRALAASQIIGNSEEFISSVQAKDIEGLKKVGNNLLDLTGQQFLTVASKNGDVFLKTDFPTVKDENILSEEVGADALEGRSAVTIDQSPVEGFSIRAASPVVYHGEIIGAIITGFLLDENFVDSFKKIGGLETSILIDKKVLASSILPVGQAIDVPGEEFLGTAKFLGQEAIASFQPLKNIDDKTVGILSLATTPGELLKNTQATNRLTLLIVFIISLSMIIPLYRFTVFLTSS